MSTSTSKTKRQLEALAREHGLTVLGWIGNGRHEKLRVARRDGREARIPTSLCKGSMNHHTGQRKYFKAFAEGGDGNV